MVLWSRFGMSMPFCKILREVILLMHLFLFFFRHVGVERLIFSLLAVGERERERRTVDE